MNSAYHENLIKHERIEYSKIFESIGFRIFLTILSLILLVVYVMRISTISVKGYDISALQKQSRELQDENQRLEFQIAQNSSMQNIQQRLKSIHFVSADKTEFVDINSPVIAKR